ncbi:MAG TPA: hypothetical protein ENI84_01810 [Thiothrix sp.]|nr:hypothetical protein [Thiothrix sp.]
MKKADDNIITAKQSRFAAKVFNYGTIASVLIPFPLFIFWFGASMFAYAMYRHHPNPRVGFYTQRAAYIYYTLAGLLVPVLTFAPKEFFTEYWWALWGAAILGVVPLAIIQIIKVNKEEWTDIQINPNKN